MAVRDLDSGFARLFGARRTTSTRETPLERRYAHLRERLVAASAPRHVAELDSAFAELAGGSQPNYQQVITACRIKDDELLYTPHTVVSALRFAEVSDDLLIKLVLDKNHDFEHERGIGDRLLGLQVEDRVEMLRQLLAHRR